MKVKCVLFALSAAGNAKAAFCAERHFSPAEHFMDERPSRKAGHRHLV